MGVVAERKSFLVRLPADLLEELNRWARDELRSLNAQIEYILRDATRKRRAAKPHSDATAGEVGNGDAQAANNEAE